MTPDNAAMDQDELRAVAGVLLSAGIELAGPLESTLIAGGRSNLTYRLTDGAGVWVLRTPPRAGRTPSAHDVAREFQVTRALGSTDVPVPTAVALHEDERPLGGPFVISAFVQGSTVQSAAELERLGPGQLGATVDSLVSTLATLHRVDHLAVGLERFGRPDGYAARQVKRWAGQWELVGAACEDSTRRTAATLIRRLSDRLPEQRSTGIVHGDYRIDNTLLDLTAEGARVAAVVDWELSTIGDPVADVAMMCVYRHPAFDLVLGEPTAWTHGRLPDVDGLASRYEDAGGVPLDAWEYHLALGYFKIAVIAAGIDHRHRAGATHGSGFDTAGDAVGPFLHEGLAQLATG